MKRSMLGRFLTSRWFLVWAFLMFTYTAILTCVYLFVQIRHDLCSGLGAGFTLSLILAGILSRYIEQTRRSR